MKKGKLNNSFHVESEPIKLCVNAITLSSLDTLNDIDSENEDALDSQNTDENSETIDSSFIETHVSTFDTDYFTNLNQSSDKGNKKPKQNIVNKKKDSKNSTFSLSDQKLVYELMRKLKPYIQNCVKKEIKSYFDTHLSKHSMTFTKFDGKIMTKIGDF